MLGTSVLCSMSFNISPVKTFQIEIKSKPKVCMYICYIYIHNVCVYIYMYLHVYVWCIVITFINCVVIWYFSRCLPRSIAESMWLSLSLLSTRWWQGQPFTCHYVRKGSAHLSNRMGMFASEDFKCLMICISSFFFLYSHLKYLFSFFFNWIHKFICSFCCCIWIFDRIT